MKTEDEKKNDKIIFVYLICAFFLAIGCFHLPIGYYSFLRIIVFITSIIWIVKNFEKNFSFDIIVSALLCILFNPFFPIYLHDKSAWTIIDALSAGWFIFLAINTFVKERNQCD